MVKMCTSIIPGRAFRVLAFWTALSAQVLTEQVQVVDAVRMFGKIKSGLKKVFGGKPKNPTEELDKYWGPKWQKALVDSGDTRAVIPEWRYTSKKDGDLEKLFLKFPSHSEAQTAWNTLNKKNGIHTEPVRRAQQPMDFGVGEGSVVPHYVEISVANLKRLQKSKQHGLDLILTLLPPMMPANQYSSYPNPHPSGGYPNKLQHGGYPPVSQQPHQHAFQPEDVTDLMGDVNGLMGQLKRAGMTRFGVAEPRFRDWTATHGDRGPLSEVVFKVPTLADAQRVHRMLSEAGMRPWNPLGTKTAPENNPFGTSGGAHVLRVRRADLDAALHNPSFQNKMFTMKQVAAQLAQSDPGMHPTTRLEHISAAMAGQHVAHPMVSSAYPVQPPQVVSPQHVSGVPQPVPAHQLATGDLPNPLLFNEMRQIHMQLTSSVVSLDSTNFWVENRYRDYGNPHRPPVDFSEFYLRFRNHDDAVRVQRLCESIHLHPTAPQRSLDGQNFVVSVDRGSFQSAIQQRRNSSGRTSWNQEIRMFAYIENGGHALPDARASVSHAMQHISITGPTGYPTATPPRMDTQVYSHDMQRQNASHQLSQTGDHRAAVPWANVPADYPSPVGLSDSRSFDTRTGSRSDTRGNGFTETSKHGVPTPDMIRNGSWKPEPYMPTDFRTGRQLGAPESGIHHDDQNGFSATSLLRRELGYSGGRGQHSQSYRRYDSPDTVQRVDSDTDTDSEEAPVVTREYYFE